MFNEYTLNIFFLFKIYYIITYLTNIISSLYYKFTTLTHIHINIIKIIILSIINNI